jgi:hypothetical protein
MMVIRRPKGKVTVWADGGEIYIREGIERNDYTTVCLTPKELRKIADNAERLVAENQAKRTTTQV